MGQKVEEEFDFSNNETRTPDISVRPSPGDRYDRERTQQQGERLRFLSRSRAAPAPSFKRGRSGGHSAGDSNGRAGSEAMGSDWLDAYH
jgi:hypothetical protein